MTYVLTLLVLLSPGDEALADSLAGAVRATLDDPRGLELRIVTEPLDDVHAQELAASARARAVGTVRFIDDAHLRATLRLYDQGRGRWVERTLQFAAEDAVAEKGRALGFTLGSMLPEAAAPEASGEPQREAAAPPAAQASPALSPTA